MKRVVVLFGAGASVELGVPATAKLTEIVADRLVRDEWVKHQGGDIAFRDIQETLSAYLTAPGVVNYEQIYHCAHELQHLLAPSAGAVDEYRPLLAPFMRNPPQFTKAALQAIERKILEIVFGEILRACGEPKRPLDPLRAFLADLKERNVLRIYTTNHDDFPLQVTEGLFTGFDKQTGRFDIDRFWRRWDDPSIFHLHGSIHMGSSDPSKGDDIGDFRWFEDRAGGYQNSRWSYASARRRQDGGNVARFPLITGLDKLSVIQQSPFCYYYAALAKDLMEADLVFVTGSGLGDLHINAWLHEARRRRPKPPLIFVDFWEDGFAETCHQIDPKLIEMWHSLGIVCKGAGGSAGAPDGWTIADDRSAAVWDRGFQDFLAHPEELNTVLGELRT